MAKKGKSKTNKRKIHNAFQIAEREQNGGADSDNDAGMLPFEGGVLDARKFVPERADEDLDDEELDSDEALGSDDDFDVLNSKFSQTIRDRRKNKEDSEEEYDSIDESEMIPLSEAWALDDKDLAKSKKLGKEVELNDEWQSESEEEESDEEESEEESEDESEESDVFEDDGDNEVNLSSTISSLQLKLKKPGKEKKRLITETTEENEFSVPTGGQKLSLADMIGAVDASVSKDAILIDSETPGKALAVPLPKSIQAKHDRKAAYEITKEQVSKWQEVVEANLDADHLMFPMVQDEPKKKAVSTFTPLEEPSTELEKRVQGLLEESALADENKEATFEEIAVAKMSKAEMQKRTAELRMMRELMFRDERRAKRLKKIKSKTYHRIKKKERLRNMELVEGSDELDPEDHDMRRAEERMSLKHKTKSKWAQLMIKSGMSKDAETRGELEEMLRQGERLRAKQLGYEDGDQSDGGVSDIEKEYSNDRDDSELRSKLGKGVLNMDFMKTAEERQRQENQRHIDELRRLRNGDDLDDFREESTSVNVTKNEGRRVYTPSSVASRPEDSEVNEKVLAEDAADRERSLDSRLSKFAATERVKVVEQKQEEKEEEPESESNPWLSGDSVPVQKSRTVRQVDQDSSKLSKAAAKIDKVAKKRSRLERDTDDAIIDMSETLRLKGDVDGSGEEDDDGEVRMFQQKNLIKEAFAGDDVVSQFEEEKRQLAQEEGDKEEDLTLPGWGSWGGEDVKPPKKKFVRKIDGVVQENKRKDKNLQDVIINETANQGNIKYQSGAVPYPFESREQYERSLRMPIGKHWTSVETHQKLTKPRIIKKQGRVIDPLKAPFK